MWQSGYDDGRSNSKGADKKAAAAEKEDKTNPDPPSQIPTIPRKQLAFGDTSLRYVRACRSICLLRETPLPRPHLTATLQAAAKNIPFYLFLEVSLIVYIYKNPWPGCKVVWEKDGVPDDVLVVTAIAQLIMLMSQCSDSMETEPYLEAYKQYNVVLSLTSLLHLETYLPR